MNFIIAADTDIGIVRKTNQDSTACLVGQAGDHPFAFGVVCDGMGGLAKGELASATLLNAMVTWFKQEFPVLLAGGIEDSVHLVSPAAIDPIQHLKTEHLGNRNPRLHTDEILIALSISAATDPVAEVAMEQLGKLRGCDVHSTVILSAADERTFKRLGVNLTSEPKFKG